MLTNDMVFVTTDNIVLYQLTGRDRQQSVVGATFEFLTCGPYGSVDRSSYAGNASQSVFRTKSCKPYMVWLWGASNVSIVPRYIKG